MLISWPPGVQLKVRSLVCLPHGQLVSIHKLKNRYKFFTCRIRLILRDPNLQPLNVLLKASDINTEIFHQHLTTSNIPDPELMIRTSGEFRISNFLLYQLAYAELYFTETLWPDFRKEHLQQAIIDLIALGQIKPILLTRIMQLSAQQMPLVLRNFM